MRKEKWLKFILFVVAPILLLSVSTSLVSAQTTSTYPKVLRMLTYAQGGLFYALASGLAKVASENTPITVMVIPTSTDSAWPSLLTQLGSADLGLTGIQPIWQMWRGKIAPEPLPKGLYSKPPYSANKDLRILMAGPSSVNVIGMLTRKESGMREVGDLRGKTVAWEWSAQVTQIALTLASLYNGGLTLDDVKTAPVTEVVAGVRALQEKRLDAVSAAVGSGVVAEADTLVGVRFLRGSMDPERVRAGQRCIPVGYPIMVRAGLPGVPEDTPIWSAPVAILVSTRMADHVAYKLVEAWWVHHKEYAAVHPRLQDWTPETFISKNPGAPYHNGAIQFYKEKGVWSPEMEKIQNQVLKGE